MSANNILHVNSEMFFILCVSESIILKFVTGNSILFWLLDLDLLFEFRAEEEAE